jgi:hypothetical protein
MKTVSGASCWVGEHRIKFGIMRNAALLESALPSSHAPKDNSPERVAFQRRDC